MKITKASNPDGLVLFAHLKSAGLFAARCGVRFPGDVYTCTLKPEHLGAHAAHRCFGKVQLSSSSHLSAPWHYIS